MESKEEQIEIDKQCRVSNGGWKEQLFINKNDVLKFVCNICKQVCCNPVELGCGDHDQLYCKLCLENHLKSNNNECPINEQHKNATYSNVRFVNKEINNLMVICPFTNIKNMNDEGNNIIDTDNDNCCQWKGKLLNLRSHLKICAVTTSKCVCEYYSSGCRYNGKKQQLIIHKNEFVVKHLDLINKDVKQTKDEINKWKLEYYAHQQMVQSQLELQNNTIKTLQNENKVLKSELSEIKLQIQQLSKNQNEKVKMKNQNEQKEIEYYHPGKCEQYHLSSKRLIHPGQFRSYKYSCCGRDWRGDACTSIYPCCNKKHQGCQKRYSCCKKPFPNAHAQGCQIK